MLRLQALKYFEIEAVNSSRPIAVTLKSNISLPTNLSSIRLYDGIKNIDFSQGNFENSLPLSLYIINQKDIFKTIRDYKIASLSIYGNQDELSGQTMFMPETYLELKNIKLLKGLNFNFKRITVYNSKGVGEIENVQFDTRELSLQSIKEKGKNVFKLNGPLTLKRFDSETDLNLSPESRVSELTLFETKTGFIHSQNFVDAVEISIKKSQINQLPLPESLPLLEQLTVSDAGPFWQLSKWPSMPKLESLLVNQMNLENLTGSLEIHSELKFINLNETKLSYLDLSFINPAKLAIIYLLGNSLKDVDIQNNYLAKKLPPYFSMFVKSPKLAAELRNVLDRKAMFSTIW